jgi:hypothetical protein
MPLAQALKHSRIEPLSNLILCLLDFLWAHFRYSLPVGLVNTCCFC